MHTGIVTPPKQQKEVVLKMATGAVVGAVLAALLTTGEDSFRYLKIAGGSALGALASYGRPGSFDPRQYF